MAISMVKILAVVYVVMCALLFLMQKRQIYVPSSVVQHTPSSLDLEFENLRLKTADGEEISAWYVPARGKDKDALTLHFSHGNGGNIGDRTFSVKTFHDMGLNVLVYDYRGYGESTGSTTEQGTYVDAKTAWDYLVNEKQAKPEDIILFGRSMGGAVAAWLAGEVKAPMLVIESAFSSAPDMAARIFPILPSRLLCRYRYDSMSRIKDIHCPVLVAHSPSDEVIPYDQGKKLFDAANEPKKFVEMSGGHNDGGLDSDSNYQRILKEFIAQHMKKGA
jgi:fermentation-respiration switch protein FrsA (DUF1100 family)